MKNQLKKGFTLIELLIVIAIIGILAGIVIASLGGSISKANDGALKGSLSALKTDAVVAIESDNTTINVCTSLSPNYFDNTDYTNSSCIQSGTNHAVNWAVVVELKADSNGPGGKNYYCIDGSGGAKLTSYNTATLTPASSDTAIELGTGGTNVVTNFKCDDQV